MLFWHYAVSGIEAPIDGVKGDEAMAASRIAARAGEFRKAGLLSMKAARHYAAARGGRKAELEGWAWPV